MLVFVTQANCIHCLKMQRTTLPDPRVAAAISAGYVPLALDGAAASPLLRDLRVQMYPSTFVISPSAIILERWEGFVPPDKLSQRLTTLGRSRTLATYARQ